MTFHTNSNPALSQLCWPSAVHLAQFIFDDERPFNEKNTFFRMFSTFVFVARKNRDYHTSGSETESFLQNDCVEHFKRYRQSALKVEKFGRLNTPDTSGMKDALNQLNTLKIPARAHVPSRFIEGKAGELCQAHARETYHYIRDTKSRIGIELSKLGVAAHEIPGHIQSFYDANGKEAGLVSELKSSDVLLSMSPSSVSEMIGNAAIHKTQFSHLLIFFRDDDGKQYLLESLIETGVIRSYFDYFIKNNHQVRVNHYRYKDSEAAANAAKQIFERIKRGERDAQDWILKGDRVKDKMNYDFSMNFDVDFDMRFDLLGEFEDYTLKREEIGGKKFNAMPLERTLQMDAAIEALFNGIKQNKIDMRPSTYAWAGGWMGYLLRQNWITGWLFTNRVPKNMDVTGLQTMIRTDEIASKLVSEIEIFTRNFREEKKHNPSSQELRAFANSIDLRNF